MYMHMPIVIFVQVFEVGDKYTLSVNYMDYLNSNPFSEPMMIYGSAENEQCYLNQNTIIFSHENTFQNVVFRIATKPLKTPSLKTLT